MSRSCVWGHKCSIRRDEYVRELWLKEPHARACHQVRESGRVEYFSDSLVTRHQRMSISRLLNGKRFDDRFDQTSLDLRPYVPLEAIYHQSFLANGSGSQR